MLSTFHVAIGHLFITFGEVSVQAFYSCFKLFFFSPLLLSFKSSLCILETVLYQISVLQTFSPSLWSSHSLNNVSHRTGFNFNEAQFINFLFMDHGFGVVSQESSPNSGSFRFSPVLISVIKKIVIFCLTFRSVIYFQLLFVKSIWYVWASQATQWVKNLPAIAGDLGLIPGLGKSPGGRHGNTLQYSYLENPMNRGAWWATVHRVAKSQTWLNTHARDMWILFLKCSAFQHHLFKRQCFPLNFAIASFSKISWLYLHHSYFVVFISFHVCWYPPNRIFHHLLIASPTKVY